MKWRRRQRLRLRQRSQQNVLEMTATLSSQKQQAHAYTGIQIHIHTCMHTLKRERERETYRQADKLTNRQTIQWLSNKACSRKTAGKDMRLLLLARKCAEGKVTGGRRGGGAVKMRTRKNLEAQIKIISSCL